MSVIGPLIGAASSLIGGLINKGEAEKAVKQEMAIAAKNIKLQKEFAQSGIKWKVEDAKEAGIHPLYALGAPTASFSPISVGGGAASGMGQAVANMGQDLSRAMDATRTPTEKVAAYDKTVMALNVERLGLENELLASQIAKIRQPGTGPGLPDSVDIAGNPLTGRVAFGSVPWSTDPGTSDAQVYENRYGDAELIQTLIGMGIGFRDFMANMPSQTRSVARFYSAGPAEKARLLRDWYYGRR